MTMTEAPKTYSFKKILMVIWLFISVFFVYITGDGCGGGIGYLYYALTAFPSSFILLEAFKIFGGCPLLCQAGIIFIAGILQWVFIVGSLLDWIVHKLSSVDNTRSPK